MIFKLNVLKKIKNGSVCVAYRSWNKLSIQVGKTLRTSVGVLQFTNIKEVQLKSITTKHAREAGYSHLDELLAELSRWPASKVFRVEFKLIGADPRLKLQLKKTISEVEMKTVLLKLKSFDERAKSGPWTKQVMKILLNNPGVASKKLAPMMGIHDKLKFKLQVRKLKELGLTISLGTGYKLSPHGVRVLSFIVRSK